MWWPTQARSPLATQKVLFSSAPQASTRPRRGDRQRERVGHVAARAAQHQRPAARRRRAAPSRRCACGSGGRGRGTSVGDRGQPLERVVVAVGDRLVGDVAARHHERHADVGEQQVVQRRVRQHHAEVAAERGATDGAPPARVRRRRGASTIGRVAPGEQRRLLVRQRDQRARRLAGRRHQRERLVLAVLARAQRGHRRLVVGAAREVVAADALDGDDPRPSRSAATAAARAPRRRQSSPRQQPQRRPALRAGVGLGVEAAVGRVLVLGRRSAAHISKPAIVVSGRS